MRLEMLGELPATKNEEESRILIGAVLTKPEWVYYSVETESLILYWVRRYLAAHARMPGKITRTVCGAPIPFAITRYESTVLGTVESAIFLNGAVIRMSKNGSENLLLFISKEDAEFWDYPATKKSMTSEFIDN